MLTPPRRALRAEPLTRVRRSNARTTLTGLYTAAFLALGVGLVAVMSGLIVHSTASVAVAPTGVCAAARLEAAAVPVGAGTPSPWRSLRWAGSRCSGRSERLRPPGRGFGVSQVVNDAGITLAVLTVIAAWMGWVISGRVLCPIRAMSTATCSVSASNLHERLAMQGPEDDVKDLADAIDALLGRLEDAFDAQRSEAGAFTGRYFVDRRPVDPDPAASDPEAARRLWDESEAGVAAWA